MEVSFAFFCCLASVGAPKGVLLLKPPQRFRGCGGLFSGKGGEDTANFGPSGRENDGKKVRPAEKDVKKNKILSDSLNY